MKEEAASLDGRSISDRMSNGSANTIVLSALFTSKQDPQRQGTRIAQNFRVIHKLYLSLKQYRTILLNNKWISIFCWSSIGFQILMNLQNKKNLALKFKTIQFSDNVNETYQIFVSIFQKPNYTLSESWKWSFFKAIYIYIHTYICLTRADIVIFSARHTIWWFRLNTSSRQKNIFWFFSPTLK